MTRATTVTSLQSSVSINGRRAASLSQMTIEGRVIEIDHSSGEGHAWRAADTDSCPADIQDEIAGEIIDGKVSACRDYKARNGEHYRWS